MVKRVRNITHIVALIFAILLPISSAAQGRSYIRNAIESWGDCRNVAITKTNGDLAIHGHNGVAMSNLPTSLVEAIDALNDEEAYIDDVVLTENGRYLILYGNNGFRWNDIPYSLEKKLREYNNANEVVLSVTFNDAGDWIVITTNYFSASNTSLKQFLKEGNEKYGMLWSVCITDDALVAVFKKGFKTFGNVPQSLTEALEKTHLDVYRLKIAGSAWFFADLKGNFQYRM